MKISHRTLALLSLALPLSAIVSFGSVGGVSGSNSFTIESNGSATKYMIVSASVSGEPVFTGTVDSVSDANISFATGTDENNQTTYPFFASGSFNKDAQIPVITSTTPSAGAIPNTFSSSNISYGDGYQSSLTGFSNAPELIVSPSDGGGTRAEVTATVTSGQITGVTVTDGGSGYSSTPSITVVGGPHFVRIIDESSDDYGRLFLIENNSQTSLTLDFSTVVDGETGNASSFFSAGTLVEIVPAATLGSIFGAYSPVSGWDSTEAVNEGGGYDNPGAADWVYLWTPNSGYETFFHVDGSGHRIVKTGWYSQGSSQNRNNAVIYPDEAFIVAKRKSGTVTLDIELGASEAPACIFLPVSGDLFVANNPYGMDMLLAELIPSTSIGTGNSKFKPGTSNSDTGMDTITLLTDAGWNTYYYKSGINSAVSSLMKGKARAGTAGSNALQGSDLFIDSGGVSNIQSCANPDGSGIITGNDANYSKITISGSATSDLVGFSITFADLQGRLLSDDGSTEANATTGESVETNGTGSIVYSGINGTHEVVGSGSGYVVVQKQRDVNFKSDEGTPVWNIGDLGGGYTANAYWWAIGGGGSGAKGTVTTGGSFTVTDGGSGYTSAPQIVVSGGGWRIITDDNAQKGGEEIGASDGLIIHRKHSTGVTAYIQLPEITD